MVKSFAGTGFVGPRTPIRDTISWRSDASEAATVQAQIAPGSEIGQVVRDLDVCELGLDVVVEFGLEPHAGHPHPWRG